MKKLMTLLCAAGAMFSACTNSPEAPVDDSNPVIEAIMGRRSIRKYQNKPVEREILQQIALCGINAPNAMNAQNWEVRIIDDPSFINGISEEFKKANPEMVSRDPNFKNMFRNAPAIICIAAPQNSISAVDCGLMGENMMLAAYSLGLGTCCQAGPVAFLRSSEEYYSKLGFSEGYELLYLIAVGYPDEQPEAKPRDESKIKFVPAIGQI